MNSHWKTSICRLSAVIALFLVVTAAMTAQVKTSTNTSEGAAAKKVTVERGEVAYVSGNDLFVKMEDGQIRHFPNVSESTRIDADGKQLGIHDLKPGMKLEHTLTVTTTPRTVTTVETVTGKVWHVSPPKSVILTLDNGQNQRFTVPDGQKFTIDGHETDVWHLKKGMSVTATRVTETPETQVQHHRKLAASMPTPPPVPPANTPILIARADVLPTLTAEAPETKPEAKPEPQPTALPKTGSPLPLIGLVGLLLGSISLCLRLVRR